MFVQLALDSVLPFTLLHSVRLCQYSRWGVYLLFLQQSYAQLWLEQLHINLLLSQLVFLLSVIYYIYLTLLTKSRIAATETSRLKLAVGRWDRKLNPGLVLAVATASLECMYSVSARGSALGMARAEFLIKTSVIDCRWLRGCNRQNTHDCKISTTPGHAPLNTTLDMCNKCIFKNKKRKKATQTTYTVVSTTAAQKHIDWFIEAAREKTFSCSRHNSIQYQIPKKTGLSHFSV